MNQTLKAKTPTIDQQIDFVRGARHLSFKSEVRLNEDDNAMLLAIEENLIAVKRMNQLLTKTLNEPAKEVSNG